MPESFPPIAGAPALAHEDAPAYDRRWLLVDEGGAWLDAARAPRLAQLNLALRFGYLVIRAPGMLRLDVPLEVIEDDGEAHLKIVEFLDGLKVI